MMLIFTVNNAVIAQISTKELITIGRFNYCDVCIPDSSVDENQCRIILSNGGLYLQNIGLNNRPIVLNKSIVDKEMIVELQEGILKIGDVDVEIAIKKDASDSEMKKPFDTSTWLKWVGIAVGVIILTGLGVIVGKTLSYNNTIETSETIIESSFEETELPTEVEEMVELFNLSNATINSIDNQTYTGTPIYYPLEIVTGDVVLTEGEDYTCTYENNTGVGVATVIVNGNGVTTTGSNTITFIIATGDEVCDSSDNSGIVNFVEELYLNSLNRYPEPNVLITTVNQLVSEELYACDLVNVVFQSSEFCGRNLSNEDFINSIYRSVLGREPDTDGYNNNLELLNNGTSRVDLINSIIGINEGEFDNICNSLNILRRPVGNTAPYEAYLDIIMPYNDVFYDLTYTIEDLYGDEHWGRHIIRVLDNEICALTDITGDDIPELFILESNDDFMVDIHVYTYSDASSSIQEILTLHNVDSVVYGVGDNYLLAKSANNELLLFRNSQAGSGVSVVFDSYAYDSSSGTMINTRNSHENGSDGLTPPTVNGASVSYEEYSDFLLSQQELVTELILFNSVGNTYCNAVTDNAYYDGLLMTNMTQSECISTLYYVIEHNGLWGREESIIGVDSNAIRDAIYHYLVTEWNYDFDYGEQAEAQYYPYTTVNGNYYVTGFGSYTGASFQFVTDSRTGYTATMVTFFQNRDNQYSQSEDSFYIQDYM